MEKVRRNEDNYTEEGKDEQVKDNLIPSTNTAIVRNLVSYMYTNMKPDIYNSCRSVIYAIQLQT